jgi:hypothetical protein
LKLFIAVPAKDQMYTHTAYCIQELVKYCAIRGIEVTTSFNLGTLVCNQREVLAQEFLDSGSDYILWIDSDMMFPADVFQRLHSHGKDVAACSYSTRALPLKGVAYKDVKNWDSWVSPSDEGLVPVQGLGMGMMLCSAKSVSSVTKPRFEISWTLESKDYLGEDMFFCSQVIKQGYQIYVDVELSKKIYHIGSYAYSFAALEGN